MTTDISPDKWERNEGKIKLVLSKLTDKEAEVVYWKSRGNTNEWIAEHITDKTVDALQKRLSQIYEKLDYPKKWTGKQKTNKLVEETKAILAVKIIDPDKDFDERWGFISVDLEREAREYFKANPPPPDTEIDNDGNGNGDGVGNGNGNGVIPPTPPIRWGIIAGGGIIIIIILAIIAWRNWPQWFPPDPTNTPTNTPTLTPTDTPTPSHTPTVTPTYTPTNTPTITLTPTPTNTPTKTPTPTNTNTPTVTLTPTPDLVLFEDNFDAGPSPAWRIIQGTPRITNGRLTAPDTLILAIGDLSWIDYEVSFYTEVGLCWMGQDNYNAVSVRTQDGDNAIVWLFSRCESYTSFKTNGNWEDQEPETGGIKVNIHFIRIVVEGEFVTVYKDDGKLGEWYNNIFPNGGVILRIEDETTIDNFKVEKILP